jgi:hypothetical protein
MATKYKATIERECWKQHVCLGCGSTYRYRLRRKCTGQGSTERLAEEKALIAIDKTLKNDVESQPCPTCGLVQPDMVGDAQVAGHGCLLVVLAIAMAIIGFIAALYDAGSATLPWIGVGVYVLGVLLHIPIARHNPNKDLEANRAKAEAEIQKGMLRLDKPGSGGPALEASAAQDPGGSRVPAFLIMLVGIAVLPIAEVVRLSSGWPRNSNCYPMVVGPGDQPTLYLPDKVESVKGLWNARTAVTVMNAKELGLTDPRLESSSKDSKWGSIIFGKRVSAQESQMWTKVKLPNAADLAGRTLQLRVNMDVAFPAKHGFHFEDEEKSFERAFELQLAAPHAGQTYRSLWWGGGLGGGIMVLVGSALLVIRARKTKKAALPSNAIPMEDAEAEPVQEALPAEMDDEPPQVLPAD